MHSFAFLLLLVAAGLSIFGQQWQQAATGFTQICILVYTWLGLRRIYGQGRIRTALKLVCLMFGYICLPILTMALTLALTVMTY